MKKSVKLISVILSCALLFSICTLFGKAETELTVTKAEEWNNLFDRTSQKTRTWLGADGIFTANLSGDDSFGSADSNGKTVFFFSDTLMGKSNSEGKVTGDWAMPSHTSAILTGNEPNKSNMKFIYGKGGDMSADHIFGEKRWLYDCVVLGQTLFVFGFSPSDDWKPQNADMWAIPIVNGEPQYNNYKKTADIKELYYRTRDNKYLYSFGMAISVDADGYIYIYGYRDAMQEGSRKDLIVSRIKNSDFPDFSHLTYWNGKAWGTKIEDCEPLIQYVSCEMSVSPIPTGPYKGKYIAVFTKDTQTENMAYAIGDSPKGPFNEPVIFYKAPEHNSQSGDGKGKLYTYNAKAHPHLSRGDKLLVSYNCNATGTNEQYSTDYHPRFLWLDLDPDNEDDESSTPSEPNVPQKGDVNGDGAVNSTDFMQVRRHYLGLYTIPENKIPVADVNNDGKINSTDFMQIRRYFLGLFQI